MINRLVSLIVAAMVIYLPIEIIFNSVELVPYILIELSILAVSLYINHIKWFNCSKIYFFFACIISILPMMYIVPVGAAHEFLLLPIALLPALLFHNRWLGVIMFTLVVVLFFVVLNTREMVDAIIEATPEQLAFFRNIYLAVAFILTFTIAFYFRTIVNDFEKIIKKKNVLLKETKSEIELQHTEIKASISYAKRIQEAILPSNNLVEKYLIDSFIYYQPKDIIAGDFYWMHVLPEPNGWDINGDTILFSAADCTGHGVPGAMVSVVCNNALNQSVKEFGITQPSLILEKTRELVIETFSESIENVQDGMDLALCSLNLKTHELQFSGANNPLWIVRDGEILETKGNKHHVGKCDLMPDFKNHKVQLQKNDIIYIFSDGYVDQFGGPKGKKFMTAKFKQLLLSINSQTMNEQLNSLKNTFNQWKGKLEQVDDVCVIGVKI
ncbi:MAG: SpoIIE family protein phosphatase [Vicingaceae bacterium]|nr:SpoIIE family protein phosphatase [Vicingaceae bacterium]